jgi:fatty acid desaturase
MRIVPRGAVATARQVRENDMMLPHPVHVIMNLEQRQNEFLAESARDQRARLAASSNGAQSRRQLADVLATLVVLVAMALLIAAGVTAAQEPPLAAPIAQIALP